MVNIAYASDIGSLVNAINKVVINPFIVLLFACAFAVFIWGVIKYLMNPGDETALKESKSHIMWGIVGMFIMVSVFAIMKIILNTLGERKIKIQNSGEVQIDRFQVK